MPKFLSTVQFLKQLHTCICFKYWQIVQNEILSKFLVIYSQFQVRVTEITSHEDEMTNWLRKLNIHFKQHKTETKQERS